MPVPLCMCRGDDGKLKFYRPLQATIAFLCALWLALIEQLRYFPALVCLTLFLYFARKKHGRAHDHNSNPASRQFVVDYHCEDYKNLPGWSTEDVTECWELLQWVDTSLTWLMISLSKLNRQAVCKRASQTLMPHTVHHNFKLTTCNTVDHCG